MRHVLPAHAQDVSLLIGEVKREAVMSRHAALTRRAILSASAILWTDHALAFRPAQVPNTQDSDRAPLPVPKATQQRQRDFQAQAAGEQGAIVFVGDSIVQGFGLIQAYFPEVRVANRGINGDTSFGVAGRLERDVLSLRPVAVVVMIGTNDLAGGSGPDAVAANIRLIVFTLRSASPTMPIFLCLIPPRRALGNATVNSINAVNAALRTFGRRARGVIIVDTWSLFQGTPGQPNAALLPDGLHPGPTGYARWAQVMTGLFRSKGLIRR